MAIQIIPAGGLWIPAGFPSAAAAPAFIGSGIITAATHRWASIFQIPKTGTLDWFETRQHFNSNTPDNGVRFSFQSLTSSGNPDNTESQYSVITTGFANNAWLIPPSYMGSTGGGSGSKRSVTKGDWIACCMRFESFVASDSVTFSTMSTTALASNNGGMTIYNDISTNSGSSWTKDPSTPIIALKYDDGTYGNLAWPIIPAATVNTRIYASNTVAADERGLLFQVPFPCYLKGVWIRMDLDGDADLIIYDAASGVVGSVSVVPGIRGTVNGANGYFEFASQLSLSANVNYRLSVKPTTTTSLTVYDVDLNDTAMLGAIDGGTLWMSTDRVDAGAWNNRNTNRPYMGLVFGGFDDGVTVAATTAHVF